jgi:hypothetical protein
MISTSEQYRAGTKGRGVGGASNKSHPCGKLIKEAFPFNFDEGIDVESKLDF